MLKDYALKTEQDLFKEETEAEFDKQKEKLDKAIANLDFLGSNLGA